MNATAAFCKHGHAVKCWDHAINSPIQRDAWEEWCVKGEGLTLREVVLSECRIGCRLCGSPIAAAKQGYAAKDYSDNPRAKRSRTARERRRNAIRGLGDTSVGKRLGGR